MGRAPSIVALLTAVALCGALGVLLVVELQRSVPDAMPRAAIKAAAADRAQARQDEFASQDETFTVTYDERMVRDRVTWKSAGYPRTMDVALVNATPGADLEATARRCAQVNGRRTAVQCYAFASTEAYEYKKTDLTATTSVELPITNLCYAARATTAAVGEPIATYGVKELDAFQSSQGCPSSWTGTTGGDS